LNPDHSILSGLEVADVHLVALLVFLVLLEYECTVAAANSIIIRLLSLLLFLHRGLNDSVVANAYGEARDEGISQLWETVCQLHGVADLLWISEGLLQRYERNRLLNGHLSVHIGQWKSLECIFLAILRLFNKHARLVAPIIFVLVLMRQGD
jgi:hypothetical protein